MEKKFELNFGFKGQRNYVQGPDILDNAIQVLEKEFGSLTAIKYSAHDWIRHNAEMVVSDKKPEAGFYSLVTFVSEGRQLFAAITDNGMEITRRDEYSEETVQSDAVINGDEILFTNTLEYTFSEVIVSMNKYYLQQTVTKDGKWIVTKLEYDTSDAIKKYKDQDLKLVLIKNFNNKLTKSAVYINDQKVGMIYFSLV